MKMMSRFWQFAIIFVNISYGFTRDDVIISSASKLVGGERSVVSHVPFVVSVVRGWGEACTGAIITDRWVVAAAACLDRSEGVDVVSVHAGVLDSLSSQDRRSTHILTQEGIPKGRKNKGGVALLQVSEPFTISEYVRPISLAKKPLPTLPMSCVAIGYGSEAQAGHNRSSYLVSSPTSAGDYHYCNTKDPNRVVGEEYVCLVPDEDNQAMSWSNTGGLLVCSGLLVGVQLGAENEDGEDVDSCIGENCTQVYTFVGQVEAWIRRHVPDIPELQLLPGARHADPEYQYPDLGLDNPCATCELLEKYKTFNAEIAGKLESEEGFKNEIAGIPFMVWAPGYGTCPGPKCSETTTKPNGGVFACSPMGKLLVVGVLVICVFHSGVF